MMVTPLTDAVGWVRSKPEMFFGKEEPDALDLLNYVMLDLLEIGRGECRIRQAGSWWLVSSDRDWMAHQTLSVIELFQRVVPAPEHGRNAMRGEVLLNAFAQDAMTLSSSERLVVRGESAPDEVIAVVDNSWAQRSLLFRMRSRK
jgi:hypothetical protein